MRRGRRRAAALTAAVVALLSAAGVVLVAEPYPVERLRPGAGDPLTIVDRRGELLRAVPAPGGRPGRDRWVPLDEVSSHAIQTLLASEDQRFYEHGGVDPVAILRAAWLNLERGELRFGASTLTMQLARMLHSAGEARTVARKLEEALLAVRLEGRLDKRQILEQYLNRVYFGHGAYGVEAAARTYFAKPAASLSVGEATYLMVLPRGPAYYDPLRHGPRALARRDHLLGLLARQGRLEPGEAERARRQPIEVTLSRPPFEAPHFTDWVLAELPEELRARGGEVRTTLDLELQKRLEHRTAEHVAALAGAGVEQAGVVVLDAQSGEVRAMVGSRGYGAGAGGQVNVAVRRRYPGSALKPFVYAAAIEAGDSPATVAYDIHDVPSAYVVRGRPPAERGPVRYREALAGSYNLAAVHVLERVGIPAVMMKLRAAGVGALGGDPEDYGLRLALGSTKVRLVDLAAGYRFLTRGGLVVPPRAVIDVQRGDGTRWEAPAPVERRVFGPRVSWLTMDILSDPEARRPMFGQELPADLPYPVVVKTGTARGFSDTVAVFATRELTAAAWTGRFDGGPTKGVFGMRGAAPLARAALLLAAREAPLELPPMPAGIATAEVCPLSGALPSPHCPHRKLEHFLAEHLPAETCDWHLEGEVRYPPEIRAWARRDARARGRVVASHP